MDKMLQQGEKLFAIIPPFQKKYSLIIIHYIYARGHLNYKLF